MGKRYCINEKQKYNYKDERKGNGMVEERRKKKVLKYGEICDRAEKMGLIKGSRLSALMDIESADKKFNLRLDDWLNADDFNFAHDYCGIEKNINRSKFPATDFGHFIPRFAGKVLDEFRN